MGSLAAVLKRDRLIIGAGVLLVTIFAWWFTIDAAREMGGGAMQWDNRIQAPGQLRRSRPSSSCGWS